MPTVHTSAHRLRAYAGVRGSPGLIQPVADQLTDISRICWRITLAGEGGKPSSATVDVLIMRKNDSVASALYQRS
jgi:hypothetical protein